MKTLTRKLIFALSLAGFTGSALLASAAFATEGKPDQKGEKAEKKPEKKDKKEPEAPRGGW